MSIDKEKKTELIEQYSRSKTDTGSPEVQIAILTQRIENLTEHFQSHNKDNHSKTGLLRIVSDRKKLLTYLKRKDLSTYEKLVKDLKIRN